MENQFGYIKKSTYKDKECSSESYAFVSLYVDFLGYILLTIRATLSTKKKTSFKKKIRNYANRPKNILYILTSFHFNKSNYYQCEAAFEQLLWEENQDDIDEIFLLPQEVGKNICVGLFMNLCM